MLSQLFRILVDAAGDSFALTKMVVGDAIDGTKNGLLSYAYRDSSGNAIAPQLNAEGSLPVTFDAGTPAGNVFTQAAGSQTKGAEAQVGEFNLTLNSQYNCFTAYLQSTRLFQWRLAYVDDANGAPSETTIAYGLSGEGELNGEIKAPKRIIDTSAGTGDQRLRLYATPIDNVDDITANVEYNELP